jgi:ubiquinone/menaquinone biosynthesis C-methylase UbiE
MFDEVAEAYHTSTPPLPSEYIELMRETFNLQRLDNILDLGCGSGLLTFPLAEISRNVQGLDSSVELLRLAKQADSSDRVEWILASVENFQFPSNRYKLIISFESFHLFPQKDELVGRISQALTEAGFFSIGWCDYHWESPFRDVIIQTFSEHGITWGEWGYQSMPELKSIITNSPKLGPFCTKSIIVNDQCNKVGDIAEYLVSIEKSFRLSSSDRIKLQQKLKARFFDIAGGSVVRGKSQYSIAYTQRS